MLRDVGDQVLSGSFVVEGAGAFEATAVGADSRAAQLTATARAFRHPRSPLERAMDRLLIVLVGVMAPLGVALGVSLAIRGVEPGAGDRDAHRGGREHRPRGADPARVADRGRVGGEDRAARRAGAAAQRDRVARVGLGDVHRQDGDADRGVAARGRAGTRRRRDRRPSSTRCSGVTRRARRRATRRFRRSTTPT